MFNANKWYLPLHVWWMVFGPIQLNSVDADGFIDRLGKIQLMGTRNLRHREAAMHAELEALRWLWKTWSYIRHVRTLRHIARINCNDKGTSCMTKFCNIIGGDKDSPAIFYGFQELPYPKSAKWNFWFFVYNCEIFS